MGMIFVETTIVKRRAAPAFASGFGEAGPSHPKLLSHTEALAERIVLARCSLVIEPDGRA
jgi:hypothetical protein